MELMFRHALPGTDPIPDGGVQSSTENLKAAAELARLKWRAAFEVAA